jgi:hypothetical protein
MPGENVDDGGLRGRGDAPFVFGVSGHRDLVAADLPELRNELRRIFRRYLEACPHRTFELLTPLAEGADRVAAEEALASGIKLVVPLPMGQAEYERDFITAESLAAFRRLLRQAATQVEITNDSQEKQLTKEGEARARRYAAVGDYIARKSHVLILLWDGKDNQKLGGTAWVKKRREYWKRAEKRAGQPDHVETVHLLTRRTIAS